MSQTRRTRTVANAPATTYIGNYPQRLRPRGVSLVAAKAIRDGVEVDVMAEDEAVKALSEGRPSEEFKCPVCGGKVHLHMIEDPGSQKMFGFSGKASFRHSPGTAVAHRQVETQLMAGDIMDYLHKIGQKNNWKPIFIESGRQDVWIIELTRLGAAIPTRRFVLAADSAKVAEKYPDAIFILTSSGQAKHKRNLRLQDEIGRPLSPAMLKYFIANNKFDSIRVSGFYFRDPKVMPEGSELFKPRNLLLIDAIEAIVRGDKDFVEGVHQVSGFQIQTNSRFGLFDKKDIPTVRKLVDQAPKKYRNEDIVEVLADELDLSVFQDSTSITTTNRYRYGRGHLLYVADEHNTEGPRLGQRKILINPSSYELLTRMEPAFWENTLVLFVQQKNYSFTGPDGKETRNNYSAFVGKSLRMRTANPAMNLVIRNVGRFTTAINEARKYLELDLIAREELINGDREPAPVPVLPALGIGHRTPTTGEDQGSLMALLAEQGNI